MLRTVAARNEYIDWASSPTTVRPFPLGPYCTTCTGFEVTPTSAKPSFPAVSSFSLPFPELTLPALAAAQKMFGKKGPKSDGSAPCPSEENTLPSFSKFPESIATIAALSGKSKYPSPKNIGDVPDSSNGMFSTCFFP